MTGSVSRYAIQPEKLEVVSAAAAQLQDLE